MIAEQGRLAWQTATDYGRRSLMETTMGRYKALIGPWLLARGFAAQRTEPDPGGRTPKFRPSSASHRIAA
jgi:hypothetical protein